MGFNDTMFNEGSEITGKNALRWVRPLRGIVCTLATQHDAAEVVDFDLNAHGLKSGDVTWGHRFMAPAPIHVRRYDDYVDALQKAKVVLDADRRKAIILADAKDLAFAQGLTLGRGRGPARGSRRPRRMAGRADGRIRAGVPRPAARGHPRHHPRQPEMFCAARGASAFRHGRGQDHDAGESGGKLANKFILVSNLVAPDGGAAIAAGNGRVVRARLADARHFWATDLAALPDAKDKSLKPLDQRLEKLAQRRLSREARHARRADRAHRSAGARACAQGRRGPGACSARGATRQGGPCHRDGRRVPRASGPDGSLLCDRAG